MLPSEFWLAWEYYLIERNRSDALMMETARCMAARLLSPFVKGGITDVRKFWPMPFDKADEHQEEPSQDDLQASLERIKNAAKWLKD